ncbi:MAG: 30S ribosomal protein S9 [Candidatus Latescibacteria bacterium]|nr:30S ribosomal protein S9 [Candidatus Latescibacterota bacterium]NIM22147.1 30S ribosomal protein S9 [Candidatus Latescibacterota bacterium]NIM64697.1 30S ribosomal protein S9 [Candidatus Latescibacterota bacterium]NIO01207.1 30S ribosomal protein S9 [Candidatus Latescibacterota bacterium]NIO27592.1 30S ribosomal protein S9 [Candidatus Latescibacterota bacterium]
MEGQNIAAVGRRKEAVARVYIRPGTGKTVVNGRELVDYLRRETLILQVRQPLELTNTLGKYDILATVRGGGITGQAGALKLGIARALVLADESLHGVLRSRGLLTRDPRMKERKKYGLAGRRKRFQFSKR